MQAPGRSPPPILGQDRDDGAIRMATQNAERAGVQDHVAFHRCAITSTQRPPGPPGLLLVNPPYGARIGNRKLLFALYGSFGTLVRTQFQGWRIGLVTTDTGLARATELPWRAPTPPVAHGPLRIQLFETDPL